MTNYYYQYDLPSEVKFSGDIAIDTETMGLIHLRDRLCVVQISDGSGDAHVVHFPEPKFDGASNLKNLLADASKQKILHFARFDWAAISQYLEVDMENIFCTKIASKLARTYIDQHGLKDLCWELLGIKISKQQQLSDWGAVQLTQEQLAYAATDVLHLHDLREKLIEMLVREGRIEVATECFKFLPTRAKLDLIGWANSDIFTHGSS